MSKKEKWEIDSKEKKIFLTKWQLRMHKLKKIKISKIYICFYFYININLKLNIFQEKLNKKIYFKIKEIIIIIILYI